MALDDRQIEELISCSKDIVKPPKKEMTLEGHHFRNDMELRSIDGRFAFRVFFRKSLDFGENFSIGLVYNSELDGSSMTLLRCNGPHGSNELFSPRPEYHFRTHLHIASEENQDSGFRPERGGQVTEDFSTFEEAVAFFVVKCGILGADQYFSFLQSERNRQGELFENGDG